jgi:hypothetical protein
LTDAGGPREIAADAAPGAAVLVPPGDCGALAAAIGGRLDALGPTSGAIRRARAPLRSPEPERFATEFRRVRGMIAEQSRNDDVIQRNTRTE